MLIALLVIGFLAAWFALYIIVVRPRLVAFRLTTGIYAKLDAWEAGFWPKAALWLKGLKVAIVGFVTSSAPGAAVFYDKIAGLDWSQLVASEKAKLIAAVLAGLGILGPMIMVALHNGALAAAAAVEPHKE